jgi:hypothetical protein
MLLVADSSMVPAALLACLNFLFYMQAAVCWCKQFYLLSNSQQQMLASRAAGD